MSHIPQYNKTAFKRLAKLADIELDHGWIGKLAAKLGIKRNRLSTWFNRNIPNEAIALIESKGYPREKWLIDEAYQQQGKHVIQGVHGDVREAESGAVEREEGWEQISSEKLKRIYEMFEEVLETKDRDIINNIYAHLEKVTVLKHQEERIKALEQSRNDLIGRVERITRNISEIKNALTKHRPPAGVEERRELWKEYVVH